MRRITVGRSTLSARLGLPIALALVLALGAACIKHPPRYETPPDLGADKFEAAENSLPVVVTDLQWNLVHGGSHLRAGGTVRNIGDQAYQSVTLYALFRDESGEVLGQGSSFVTPTYLPPGREGSFEITIMMTRQKTVKHLHLVSNAQVLY